MKIHGIMKDGTTACGEKITPDLIFFTSEEQQDVNCKNCLIKIKNDLVIGDSGLITKKPCLVTIKFMEMAITILQNKGLQRLQVLERLGYSHSSFIYLKQGKTRMSLREALRIARLLNVSVDYLSGRIDSQGNILE